MVNFITLGQFDRVADLLERKTAENQENVFGILTCLSLGIGDIYYLCSKQDDAEAMHKIAQWCPAIKYVEDVLPDTLNVRKHDADICILQSYREYLDNLKSDERYERNMQCQCPNAEIGYLSGLLIKINKLESMLIPISQVFMYVRAELGLSQTEFRQSFKKYLSRFNV